jgi:hypothetical protein
MSGLQESPPEFLMITELAKLKGVDEAAISRRVGRLVAQGLLKVRRGPKGSKLVNVAEFDRVIEMAGDAVNEMNGRAASSPADPILAREQARKTAIAADLAQLELDKRLGLLLPLDEARQAARNCAERLRRSVEQMPSRAEEVASGLAKDSPFARAPLEALRSDPQGARTFFKALAREQLAEMARMATAFDAGSQAVPEGRAAEDVEQLGSLAEGARMQAVASDA